MSASSKKKLRKEQNAAAMTEKQQKEMKDAKKLKAYTLTFVVVMILVVAIVIGVSVRGPIAGLVNRGTHAITIGEHELSTVDLSYFYVDAINDYYNTIYNQYYPSYGNYWQLALPFDATTPLDEQKQGDGTWADYFVEQAVESATSMYGVYDQAVAAGHKLTEEEQKTFDSYMDKLDSQAASYGYSNAKSFLRGVYGDGADLKSYRNYYYVSAMAASYYANYVNSLEYKDEDYRDYEKGKFNNYSSFTYAVYQIKADSYLGEGTKDESGKTTYTAEQKAAALEAAKKDAEILAGSPVSSIEQFDNFIKTLTVNKDKKDVASTQYDNVFYGNISESDIQRWVGNANRKPNEMTVIPITQTKTNEDKSTTLETKGYYVVLFVERNDNLDNLIDVRHILVKFEGGTKDSTTGETTYNAAEKNAAKLKAETLLENWKTGAATEESFGVLANLNSADSDGTDGGLYENVYPGQMVTAFNDWCFNENRKAGDTGIVETEFGYHVMYFVKTQDLSYRDYMIKNDLTTEAGTDWLDEISEAVKVTKVNLSGLELDYVLAY